MNLKCWIKYLPWISSEKLSSNSAKWIKTVALIAVWFTMGMSSVLVSTALPDIRTRLGVNVEQISRAFAFGGFGGIIGGPLGSLTDRYHTYVDAILSTCLFTAAISIFARCLTTNLTAFTVQLFMDGVSWLLVNSAGNSLIIKMWGEEGGVPMHALHFGYPLGAMIGPLLVYPYVSKNNQSSNITTKSITTFISDYKFKDESSIEIPFAMVACIVTVMAVIFLVFQVILPSSDVTDSHKSSNSSWNDVLSPTKWGDGDAKFGLSIVILGMLFYALHIASVKGLDTYSIIYAVDHMGFTKQEGALLNAFTHFAGTLGRGVAIICAKFIPIKMMFLFEVHAVAVISILIVLWGLNNKIMFLVLGSFFSFFCFPIWPGGYTWLSQFITLYAIVFGLFDMAAQISNVLFSWIIGYLYTYTAPINIFYNTNVTTILLCILVVIMNMYGDKRKSNRKFALVTKAM